jgi:hypothetical protein
MANFNLDQYETVEQRHARALEQYPDLRCITINHTSENDRAMGMWVAEARVYLNADDQLANLPKATEWAFEVDGVGMANKTSALENACTSALGRALRWALGGSKGPSREEMAKAERGITPEKAAKIPADFDTKLAGVKTVEELNEYWVIANAVGFAKAVQNKFAARKKELTA